MDRQKRRIPNPTKMNKEIKEWSKEWHSMRARTIQFLESVPQEKWNWKPHDLLGTFGMQVRHMCVSQRSYIEGIKSGKIEFSKKEYDAEVEINKDKAMQWLKLLDQELLDLLDTIEPQQEIIFVDGVEGESKDPVITILSYLKDHEYFHQGIFTCYGRIAGLGKFLFM